MRIRHLLCVLQTKLACSTLRGVSGYRVKTTQTRKGDIRPRGGCVDLIVTVMQQNKTRQNNKTPINVPVYDRPCGPVIDCYANHWSSGYYDWLSIAGGMELTCKVGGIVYVP